MFVKSRAIQVQSQSHFSGLRATSSAFGSHFGGIQVAFRWNSVSLRRNSGKCDTTGFTRGEGVIQVAPEFGVLSGVRSLIPVRVRILAK